jgi:hypothetical protein
VAEEVVRSSSGLSPSCQKLYHTPHRLLVLFIDFANMSSNPAKSYSIFDPSIGEYFRAVPSIICLHASFRRDSTTTDGTGRTTVIPRTDLSMSLEPPRNSTDDLHESFAEYMNALQASTWWSVEVAKAQRETLTDLWSGNMTSQILKDPSMLDLQYGRKIMSALKARITEKYATTSEDDRPHVLIALKSQNDAITPDGYAKRMAAETLTVFPIKIERLLALGASRRSSSATGMEGESGGRRATALGQPDLGMSSATYDELRSLNI